MAETQSFVIILRPAPAYGTSNSGEKISEHFGYLKELHEKGKVRMAGRFSDVLFGLVLIEATDRAEAVEIMQNDPAVKSKVFHAELYPWTIAIGI